MKPFLLSLCLLTFTALTGCASAPHAGEALRTTTVDADRYMGRWYVIANIPYAAEAGNVGSYFEYSRRTDGAVNVIYYFREKTFIPEIESKSGSAQIFAGSDNARWQLSLGWSFKPDYSILYVDPDYRYAVVGDPSRDYAWILAREIYVSDEVYPQLLDVLSKQGFDVSRLIKIPQRPEYLGLPGYQ